MQSEEQIVLGLQAYLREQELDQKRRAEYLLEIGLELRAESETDQSAQTDIFRGTRESLQVRGVNGGLHFLDVRRMPQARHRVPVKEFEHFRIPVPTPAEESRRGDSANTGVPPLICSRTYAPILDCFQPTIRFLDHERKRLPAARSRSFERRPERLDRREGVSLRIDAPGRRVEPDPPSAGAAQIAPHDPEPFPTDAVVHAAPENSRCSESSPNLNPRRRTDGVELGAERIVK